MSTAQSTSRAGTEELEQQQQEGSEEGGAEREYAAVQVLPQFVPFPAIICVWKTQGKYATMVA